MTREQAAPAEGAVKKKKKKPLVLILLVALILLGGGAAGAAYVFMAPRGPAPEPAPPEPGIAALDTFVVNLADPGGRRFLRVTLRLVVESQEAADRIASDELVRTRVRSAILEHLTLQTADGLVTPDGKAALKRSIADQAGAALGATVSDVLFTEFVVQF